LTTDVTEEAITPAPERLQRADGPRQLIPPATGFAVFLAALWGGNALAVKAGLDDAPPLRLAWMRFVIGGVVTAVWAFWTKQPIRLTRSELRPFGWLALLSVTRSR